MLHSCRLPTRQQWASKGWSCWWWSLRLWWQCRRCRCRTWPNQVVVDPCRCRTTTFRCVSAWTARRWRVVQSSTPVHRVWTATQQQQPSAVAVAGEGEAPSNWWPTDVIVSSYVTSETGSKCQPLYILHSNTESCASVRPRDNPLRRLCIQFCCLQPPAPVHPVESLYEGSFIHVMSPTRPLTLLRYSALNWRFRLFRTRFWFDNVACRHHADLSCTVEWTPNLLRSSYVGCTCNVTHVR